MRILNEHVAIITGASSGIGEATARVLAAEGAAVVLAARREERLQDLKQEIEDAGGRALVVAADVTDRQAVQRLADATMEAYGRIDILVNNAGVMPLSFMKNLHEEEWHRMVDVNIKGVLNGLGAVLPVMMDQERGHIVNVGSVAGKRVFPAGAVYCATKFAVRALSEGLRTELAPRKNIRVTCIEPGAVATELTNHITDEDLAKRDGGWDFKFLESEDIAQAIRYAVTAPPHVDVAELLIMPREQA